MAGGHNPVGKEKIDWRFWQHLLYVILRPCMRPYALTMTRVLCNLLVFSLLWVCLLNSEKINKHDNSAFQGLPH